jgi:uncharacterized membrane protein
VASHAGSEPPRREFLDREELPVARLDAFSDGVFAIAVTIIVLELGISTKAANHLLSSILHHWPAYLAYVTSFFAIGVIWLQHSAVTATLRAADATLFRLNLLVLLFASFLPVPTRLVTEFIAEGGPERVSAVFYGLAMLALTLAFALFARYAEEQPRLVKDPVEAGVIDAAMRHSPRIVLYLAGIGISFVLPTVGIVIYLVSAIAGGFPAHTFRSLPWKPRRTA